MTSGRRRLLRRLVVGAGALIALAAFVLVWQPALVYRLLARAFPRIVWRVDTTQPLVALSFDDGPAPDHTPEVLDILARNGAHATFFLIGDRAEAHPEMVERIRAAGHEVGNHHYSLRSTLRLTDAEYVDGLRRFVSIGTLLASR